ncbi:TonB-dependent receptor domain-containing protein [Sorangium sp. So ce887]|uniref:TonB-dependent receptor domain-containing protein n=1 Tax=Sorangium sp. So ce887 TaxID=3133324 RepID=UPI003F5D61A5
MASTASSAMHLLVSEALLLAVVMTGSTALAQPAGAPPPEPPPEPPPSEGDPGAASVPRGGAGAVVVPQPGTAQPAPPIAISAPKLITYAPPAYPVEAQQAGVEGSVILKLDIDRTGRVTKAEVTTPGGHGFDEAALAAAPGLVFEPARRPDGTPAPSRILYRYGFTLTPKPADAAAPAPPADVETVVGTVLSASTGEALPDIAVSLLRPDGGREDVKTDQRGKFLFKNLPPGKYRVEVAAAGFEPFTADEDIAAGEAIEVRYRISLAAPKDGKAPGIEVTVQGERPPREVTRRTIERREIDRIPGTGGDALRSLQSLPGVARSGFGLLIVRGSAPQDTLTFIDRTPVPIIYHFGGLSSVVPTEMLEKIDFYPGNFSAVYGRAMGGIVDVGLRSPKQDGKYHGVVQLDLIDGRVLLEGPVPYLKDWTFIAAGRRSWVDAWLGPVLKEAGSSVTQAPVYYDYQLVVEGRPSASERVRASVYGSDDAFKITLDKPPEDEPALTGDFGLHTAFQRFQLSYENRLGTRDRILWSLALGRDVADFEVAPLSFNVTTTSLDLRLELSHRFARYLTMNVGTDLSGGIATVNLHAPTGGQPAGHPSNQPFSTLPVQDQSFDGAYSRPAAYAEFEIVPSPRGRIVPGVRVDYALDTQTLDVSPRVNARYDIRSGFPRTTAKGGVGLYYQAPQFNESIEPFGNPELKSNRAIHYGLGVEQEITPQIDVTVDGFYKQLDRLVVMSPEKEGYANDGTGYAVGGEVLLKYKPDERFFGWAAYTLSRSVRTDGPGKEEYLAPWDQTHVLTVLGSLRLGRGWEVGARFRVVSGNLQTPYVCDPEQKGCDPNRVNAIYHASSAKYSPIPLGGDYSERMPVFHQLDIRADKTWKFKTWQLGLYLDVQNVYNFQAAEGISYNFNFTKREYVTGLPFLPTLGLRGDF